MDHNKIHPETPNGKSVPNSTEAGFNITATQFKATWRAPDGDVPVTIIGDLGAGPDGRHYLKASETATGIPTNQLIFAVSLFNNKYDTSPKPASWTIEDLERQIRDPEVRAEKDGPLISAGVYLQGKTRLNENVTEISMLWLDYDHGADLDTDARLWEEKGLTFAAYTTHSSYRRVDKNPEAEERFRIVLPLATPIPAGMYRALWAWAQRETGGKLDENRKDQAGMFYLPAIADQGARYEHMVRDGALLDWRGLDLAEPKPEQMRPHDNGVANGRDSHNGNQRYADAALKNEVDLVASAVSNRNAQLNKSAFALGQLVGAGVLNRGDVEAELERAAVACGLDKDREGGGLKGVRATIKSGLDSGERQPREIPERKFEPKRKQITKPAAPRIQDDVVEDESPGAILSLPSAVLDDDQIRTDFGNAARFYNKWSGLTRYVEARKKFYSFDGRRWRDKQALVEGRAKQTINDLRTEANKKAEQGEKTESVELFEYAIKCQKPDRMRAILELVRSEIDIDFEAFDSDPEVFTVWNGTIHLSKGEFREHNPKDLCTKISRVKFDKNAKCPTWKSFLDGIFSKDQDLIKFIQKAVGYSLSGLTVEQVFFLLYGIGKNGKTTFVNVLGRLLGEYASHAQMDLFTPKHRGTANGHNEELANLAGARLVTAIETEESKRLSEALIKQITGGDPVTASRKHEHAITFRPQFKLWLAANHKPIIRGTDEGIWRRPLLIPFLMQFEKDHEKAEREGLEKADKNLESKLIVELPGILNWALEGFKLYSQDGLNPPDSVRMATQEFRAESDLIGLFIIECLDQRNPVGREPLGDRATEIYKAWCAWCADNGERADSQKSFGANLRYRGITSDRDGAAGGKVVYPGVFLKPDMKTQMDLFHPQRGAKHEGSEGSEG